MTSDDLWNRIAGFHKREAIYFRDHVLSYTDLADLITGWEKQLSQYKLSKPSVVALRSDFKPDAIALFLALLKQNHVVVLLPDAPDYTDHLQLTGAVAFFDFSQADVRYHELPTSSESPELIEHLFSNRSSGFVVFSSGSSGDPKGIVHDTNRFLSKFTGTEQAKRLVNFFLLDHIAGIDRLFLGLISGSLLIFPEKRSPKSIAQLIEKSRAESLPVSPSFVNLLLLSKEHRNYDLSSLREITYGSEPIAEATLNRLNEEFPNVHVSQTYGTTETGSLTVCSKDRCSLWIKPGANYFQWDVRDNRLWIYSRTNMLGYLNRPSPVDANGWYPTEDRVEADGEWIHVLGRDSEMIIVGGEKVFPQEIEKVVEELDDVIACLARGETNPILGNVVTATVQTDQTTDLKSLQKTIRKHCRSRLAAYKVPVTIKFTQESLVNRRHKKFRSHLPVAHTNAAPHLESVL